MATNTLATHEGGLWLERVTRGAVQQGTAVIRVGLPNGDVDEIAVHPAAVEYRIDGGLLTISSGLSGEVLRTYAQWVWVDQAAHRAPKGLVN